MMKFKKFKKFNYIHARVTTFMISLISSLEIINVVKPDTNIFLWIAASVVDTNAVNANGIKALLADDLST